MLTIEEISAVHLFLVLPKSNLERLARTSADLHLNSGEFAIL
jgi:thioredoxin reductase (NADPH)